MRLSINQAISVLKSPRSKREIQKGLRYESRLRLYTEPIFKADLKSEPAWSDFTKDLEQKLTKKRYERVLDFIQTPLPVVDVTESLLTELFKVFDAKNSFFNFETSDTAKSQVEDSLDELNPIGWIEKKGKEVLKNKPNSAVVIDKDEEGKPFLLLIDNERIIDTKVHRDGTMEYIAFEHSKFEEGGKLITIASVYDDEFYRLFRQSDGGDWVLIEGSEVAHTAGATPARMFMSSPLTSKDNYNRAIPFSNVMSKLQEWTLFDIYKFYADHYGPFPIIEAPEEVCSVLNCNGGIVTTEEPYFDHDNQVDRTRQIRSACPNCSEKSIIGPGTIVNIPAKSDKDDPDSSGVLKIHSPATDNLTYLKDKLSGIEEYVELKVVGVHHQMPNQAINEMQVQGSFESRQNVLVKLKKNFDILHSWIVKTTAALVVPNVEIDCMSNFGTEFYLLSETDLQERFEKAKEIGLPEVEIDMIYRQLVNTKYKGNPDKLERAELIKMLDPIPYNNFEEVCKKFEKGVIDAHDFVIKNRLISFVDKFEREQGPITLFGSELELDKRVEKIKQIFKTYANEQAKQIGSGTEASVQTEGGISTNGN